MRLVYLLNMLSSLNKDITIIIIKEWLNNYMEVPGSATIKKHNISQAPR